MGVGQNAIATRLATRGELLWNYPADWTAAQAATVPVAYCTAYYSLVMRGRLRPGQRVLIHSGSGAVGLAAIAICLHRGCEVSNNGWLYINSRKYFEASNPCSLAGKACRCIFLGTRAGL